MRIYQKLAAGFLTVSFAVFSLAYIVIVVQEQLIGEFQQIAGSQLPGTVAESGVQTELYRIMACAVGYEFSRDPREKDFINKLLAKLETEVTIHRLYHQDYDINEHVEVMEALSERFVSLVTQYVRLIDLGADRAQINLARRKADDVLSEFALRIAPIIERHLDNARKSIVTTKRYGEHARAIVLGTSAFVLVLSLTLGFFISRFISQPIMALTDAAKRIGRGELDTRIDIQSKDEVGILASTLNSMARDLKEITVSRDAFAKEVEERKKVQAALRESEQMLSGVVSSVTDSMILLDEDLNILWTNDVAKAMLGKGIVGGRCYNLFHGRSSPCTPCIVRECFDDGGIHDTETEFLRPDGSRICVWATANVAAFGEDGRPIRVVEFMRNITERQRARDEIARSLREKEILLKEIHHRVKNNMQVISSLLRLRASQLSDKRDAEVLRDSQNQIRSMALVHEKLYQSGDLANIDFHGYVKQLAGDLFRSYGVDPGRIGLKLDMEDIDIGIDAAIPCGLIISELVSNSIKYAFPGQMQGQITISLCLDKQGQVELVIRDNGVGLPEGMEPSNVKSLGLRLVSILVKQLNGKLELDRSQGTTFRIIFDAHMDAESGQDHSKHLDSRDTVSGAGTDKMRSEKV